MTSLAGIREHMEVIGADGVRVGTVDRLVGDRLRLNRADSGEGHHHNHHHYIPGIFIAGIEDDRVRLSANAAIAVLHEEEEDGEGLQ